MISLGIRGLRRGIPITKAMGNLCSRNHSFSRHLSRNSPNASSSARRNYSEGGSHHLDRTASEPRAQYPFWAVIRELWPITPTIRGVRLEIDYETFFTGMPTDAEEQKQGKEILDSFPEDAVFDFKPGQWVDFLIPGTNMVGGYSMISLPNTLPMVDLAVKYSKHPPADWVTNQAKVGDRVVMKVGGNFVYELPPAHQSAKLLLVAGGIGINPLYAILQHLLSRANKHKIVLLYSAKTPEELAFREHIQQLALAHPDSLRVLFAVTGADVIAGGQDVSAKYVQDVTAGRCGVMSGRFCEDQLGSSAEWIGDGRVDGVDVLVCGPQGMPETIQNQCVNVGIKADNVRFEKWW